MFKFQLVSSFCWWFWFLKMQSVCFGEYVLLSMLLGRICDTRFRFWLSFAILGGKSVFKSLFIHQIHKLVAKFLEISVIWFKSCRKASEFFFFESVMSSFPKSVLMLFYPCEYDVNIFWFLCLSYWSQDEFLSLYDLFFSCLTSILVSKYSQHLNSKCHDIPVSF